MQCLQLTMDFIISLAYWNQHPEAEPLLAAANREFSSPDTVIAAPKRRPQPLGAGTNQSSSSSIGGITKAGHSPSISRLSQERLKRNETISLTFSGRMRPLRTSQPPTPSTAHSRQFPIIQRSTSSTSTPLPKMRLPMPPFAFSTLDTRDSSPEREGSKTQPLPTPVLTRPPNPVPMARSVSEPQGLSDMNQFAAHQIARGRSGSISVDRGRMNRPRAATGSTTAAERLANLPTPLSFGEMRRGRSPGPRSAGLGSGRPSPLGLTPRPLLPARSISNDLLNAPDVPTDVDQESAESEVLPELVPQTEAAEEEGVVRRDLGLRGIFPSRRGQRRGRPGRGRAITH